MSPVASPSAPPRLSLQTAAIAADTTTLRSQDWDRSRFDIEFGLRNGTTYNAFLIRGERTALVDTSHAKFRAKHGLTVLLGSDEGAVTEAFGVWVEKSMYGKKYMGIERATFLIGRDGVVAQAWPKVKVPGHAEAVLAAAQALA